MKRVGKNREQTAKTISYRLQFIDSSRFIVSSLSNLVGNPADGMYKIKCMHGVELNTEIVSAIFNTQMLKII